MRAASIIAGVLVLAASACLAVSSFADGGSLAAFGVPVAQPTAGEGKKQKPLSDPQVRQILIDESIAAYSGNCPCPYSTARNGSRCGKRSAWSRAGGEEPLCYPKDVSAAMVEEYRNAHPAP